MCATRQGPIETPFLTLYKMKFSYIVCGLKAGDHQGFYHFYFCRCPTVTDLTLGGSSLPQPSKDFLIDEQQACLQAV